MGGSGSQVARFVFLWPVFQRHATVTKSANQRRDGMRRIAVGFLLGYLSAMGVLVLFGAEIPVGGMIIIAAVTVPSLAGIAFLVRRDNWPIALAQVPQLLT